MVQKVKKKGWKKEETAIKPIQIPLRRPNPLKRPGEIKRGVRGEPERVPPPPFTPDI